RTSAVVTPARIIAQPCFVTLPAPFGIEESLHAVADLTRALAQTGGNQEPGGLPVQALQHAGHDVVLRIGVEHVRLVEYQPARALEKLRVVLRQFPRDGLD